MRRQGVTATSAITAAAKVRFMVIHLEFVKGGALTTVLSQRLNG
jgi:hypothetical protein